MSWRDLSPKLVALICVFASGSWVAVNGIWVELPLLVTQSPQEWSLPSYLTVAVQLANLGPTVYILINKYLKNSQRNVVNEVPVIYFILAVGVLASALLALLWRTSTSVNGKEYSLCLILFTFFLATVDCTSSVTFLPFMASFPPQYMIVYFVGEGMSGFIPSMAALIQGTNKPTYTCELTTIQNNVTLDNHTVVIGNTTEIVPHYIPTSANFSVSSFFWFIAAMMVFSLVAFILLVRVRNGVNNDRKPLNVASDVEIISPCMSNKTLYSLLAVNAVINGVNNGILPAIQSYACMPYGQNIYHLTLIISAVANPISCFLYFFASIRSMAAILIGAVLYLTTATYTVVMAASSPCPILNANPAGGVLVLLFSVIGVGLVSYLKTAISAVLRDEGHKALQLCGISMQLGSLLAALLMFPLVNMYDMFQQSQPCQKCG